jgi:hypothetical protein
VVAIDASPFGTTAVAYHMRGWLPFPLWDPDPATPPAYRARGKSAPPKGYTGRGAHNATREQLETWRDSGRFFNLGSRMPDTVVAIDVDAYHGGAETLADLEKRLGRLPATYTVTARSDGSGHRYFAVEGRRVWRNPGTGIEVLHWGWRYAVFPPSVHPTTNTPYAWFGPRGERLASQLGPRPETLTPLPAAWVAYLDTGDDPSAVTARTVLDPAHVRALLGDWATDDEPCWHMVRSLTEATSTTTGGRHDACMKAQMAITRYAECGHPGGRSALAALRRWFFGVLTDRDPSMEWQRGLTQAVEHIAATPTPADRHGCRAPSLFTTFPTYTTRKRQAISTTTRQYHPRSA